MPNNSKIMMQTNRISSDGYNEFKRERRQQDFINEFIWQYHKAVLRAVIETCGAEVYSVDTKSRYVQNPCVVLPGLGITLLSDKKHSEGDDILVTEPFQQEQEERDVGYSIRRVEGAYFEGGNVLYDQTHGILLHGISPIGKYKRTANSPYKEDPKKTSEILKDALTDKGCGVLNVDICDELKGTSTHGWKYYHLDCFMQPSPDGKLYILNLEMLSEESQKSLKEQYGDNLVDLGYKDYIKEPVFLNLVFLNDGAKDYVVSPDLPEEIISKFEEDGYTVVTPSTLNSENSLYDPELGQAVANNLVAQGYTEASGNNLFTKIPANEFGYDFDDGSRVDGGELKQTMENFASTRFNASLDKYYKSMPPTFCVGSGGPHCMAVNFTSVHRQKQQYVPPNDAEQQAATVWRNRYKIKLDKIYSEFYEQGTLDDTAKQVFPTLTEKELNYVLTKIDSEGMSGLMIAFAIDEIDTVKTILDNLDPNTIKTMLQMEDKNGTSMLMFAIESQNLDLVKIVIDNLDQNSREAAVTKKYYGKTLNRMVDDTFRKQSEIKSVKEMLSNAKSKKAGIATPAFENFRNAATNPDRMKLMKQIRNAERNPTTNTSVVAGVKQPEHKQDPGSTASDPTLGTTPKGGKKKG